MLVRISYLLLPLFRANCKDIDEILAFRIYKPPYYAYRYQPLEGAELESREFVFTKYRAPKFQFPKYFILEDFDLDIIKSTREHQILQSKNNNIYLSLLGNRGLKIVCLSCKLTFLKLYVSQNIRHFKPVIFSTNIEITA